MATPRTGVGRGGKAKPAEVKRALGNPGKRKLAPAPTPSTALEVVELGKIPPPPAKLGEVGRATWAYVWNAGRRWLGSDQDAMTVALIATKTEEIAKLRDWLGEEVERRWYTTANGQVVTHPAVTQIAQGEAQITAWLSQLAIPVVDRTRLGLAEIRVADALDEYRQRKAQRSKPA